MRDFDDIFELLCDVTQLLDRQEDRRSIRILSSDGSLNCVIGNEYMRKDWKKGELLDFPLFDHRTGADLRQVKNNTAYLAGKLLLIKDIKHEFSFSGEFYSDTKTFIVDIVRSS
ncbi:hypothetical protein [Aridibaculum aurantiacum]|uniref:hypothetical protein n=1 Tax=Aridibaculum aurantiacum TaxID=2810307 RepID=UPI001A972874|nr:hypothetical protein [Aridibaculum aurantiacum]